MSSFAIASSALADGMESLKDGPAPSEEYVWDGLYVGVGIGAGSFDHSVDVDATKTKTKEKCMKKKEVPDLALVSTDSVNFDPCYGGKWEPYGDPKTKTKSASFSSDDDWHLFGTMQVGYDRLIHKRFLIGAFADFDFYQDADDSFSETLFTYGKWGKKEFASVDGDIELDHVWNIGGRLGILVTPRILFYGVGGYSEASLDGGVTVDFKHGPTLNIEAPDDLQGYFYGGGVELKLRKNVSLKVEYRHAEYDDGSGSDTASKTYYKYNYCDVTKITKDFDAHADFDTSIDTIRGVLVLKFDEPERPVAALK